MRLTSRSPVTRHLCCFLAYVLFFEPIALALAQTPALSTPRVGHTTSITGDGAAIITGGRSQPGGTPTDSAERYEPASEAVTPVPGPMTSPRAGHGAASTPTGEVVLGGGEDTRGRLATLENYLPGLGQFVPSALALPGPLSHFTATTLSEGRILVVGGYNGSSLASGLAYLLNPRTQAVVPSKSQLATPRAKHVAALLVDGRVAIIAGDTSSGPTASIELYDAAQDAFSVSPVALTTPRSEAAVALLPSGQLLVTGGRGLPAGGVAGPDGTVRADSELVDLTRGTVAPGPALPGPRAGHTLSLLPDSGLLLAGGTDGQSALKNLDPLQPLALDATAPSVVHVSPPDNAQDVPLDTIVAVRFSEPMRVTTVTAANVVLTGPSGRVEGTVATAESGLLAFFTPSLLEADTPYVMALAGITDTSGNPLPAFSSRFRTGRSAGDTPRVASFTPTAGSEGDEVTLRGERFTGATRVAFGGIAAASFALVNDTTLKAIVPSGAVTGPLSVTTPAGTGTSSGHFVVLSKPDFKLAAAPDRGETVPGDTYVFALNVVPSGGFNGLVRLAVSGLPSQLSAKLDKPMLGPVGYAYLTVAADSRVRPEQYQFTVTGTADLGGKSVQRTVDATLRVLAGGGTSLSGHVRRLDGAPVANAIFRVGRHSTRTDAGGNFLLRDVPGKPELVFVLDARPANTGTIEYPVFEMLMGGVVPGRPNKVNPGPIWIPTMDSRNAVRVDTSQDTVLRPPHFPGMEVALAKGTKLTDVDGRPVTRVNAALIPLNQGPFPMPPHVQMAFMYTVQPSGSIANQPMTITLPNPANLPARTRLTLWAHDPRKGGWYNPGGATVTDDGKQIQPDAGVTVTRFSCVGALPPPGAINPIVEGTAGADPVDLASGLLSFDKTDLVLPGRIPLVFTRTYRSSGVRSGAFGYGWNHNFDLLFGAGTAGQYEVALPSDARIDFYSNVHTATPTYYGARLESGGTSPYPYRIILKDGTLWGFDGDGGNLVAIEDRHGNKITIQRQSTAARSPANRIIAPDGRVLNIEYDGSNRITRIVGPLEQTVTYTYSLAGDLATVTDPVGGVTTYTYDGTHNLLTITDPRGITYLTNEYDANQRVFRQTMADGGIWQLAYTLAGSTVTQTVVTDPRGKTTTYAFNPAGYGATITNALGQTTTIARGAGNLVTEVLDHLGRKTVIGYEANKNVSSITRYKDPPANTQPVTRTFTYDTASGHYNLLTSVTDPLGHTWTYGLDPTGKTGTSITDPLTQQTTIAYNSFGQPTQTTDALSHSTFLGYDLSTGLLSTVTDHLGNTTTYGYDLLGRRVAVTDPRGATTRFTYDFLNRVLQVADPLGRAVLFEYDPNSNLTKVTDPRGGQMVYAYDNMDRLQTRTDPLGRQETYTYDAQGGGTLTSFRDRKNQLTSWAAYDDLNRPTTVTFQDGSTLTYNYDAAIRLFRLDDSISGSIARGFDALDRLTSETTPQGVVTYVPDDADRRATMMVAGQPPVAYTWDNANRLQTITRDAVVASYGYDVANRRTSLQLPNGVTIGYAYDETNRLTGLTYSGLVGGNQNLIYTYDPTGNRIAMGGSWARTLLPATITTASYDAANRQLTLGGKTMTYDNNGNLATLTESGNTTTYTWDPRDRLTNIGGPGLTASFAYDAKARRTQKTVNAFATIFQYDGWEIVREVAGGSTANYLRGLGIDETLARIEESGASCYLGDSLGSTVALTASAGGVETEYTYEPFGRTTVTGTASQNGFQFTGRENDSTGLYHYRARYYLPGTHRFISEDPLYTRTAPLTKQHKLISESLCAGGMPANLYSYTGNNPVRYTDPYGLEKTPNDCRSDCLVRAAANAAVCVGVALAGITACLIGCGAGGLTVALLATPAAGAAVFAACMKWCLARVAGPAAAAGAICLVGVGIDYLICILGC